MRESLCVHECSHAVRPPPDRAPPPDPVIKAPEEAGLTLFMSATSLVGSMLWRYICRLWFGLLPSVLQFDGTALRNIKRGVVF